MLSSTGGSGGVLDVFYEDWKLSVNQHPRVVHAIQDLWANTWSVKDDQYQHPYEDFNPFHGYMYIDRYESTLYISFFYFQNSIILTKDLFSITYRGDKRNCRENTWSKQEEDETTSEIFDTASGLLPSFYVQQH